MTLVYRNLNYIDLFLRVGTHSSLQIVATVAACLGEMCRSPIAVPPQCIPRCRVAVTSTAQHSPQVGTPPRACGNAAIFDPTPTAVPRPYQCIGELRT